MWKFQVVALVLLVALSGGCSSLSDRKDAVRVRIANRSAYDFEKVTITFPDGVREYGRVAKGAASGYQEVKNAYGYAPVEVTIQGGSLRLQPQDYLGEKPLAPGRYTYALSVDESGRSLRLELVKD